jgi:hypothetical protein
MTTSERAWMFTDQALDELHYRWRAPGRTDAERQQLTSELATRILAAKPRTRVDNLVIARAGWSKERARQADAIAAPGTPQWMQALGAHEDATLTTDGDGIDTNRWCDCDTSACQWVYYEHWTARGCEGHGWAHRTCRRITQTG